jgi:hypothetical protein
VCGASFETASHGVNTLSLSISVLPESKELLIGGAPDFFCLRQVRKRASPIWATAPVAARRERPSRADHFRPFTGYGQDSPLPVNWLRFCRHPCELLWRAWRGV